ncbi:MULTISPECIES: GNAT family N-acetyltransferase [Paenibacillus]|uniref:GNAT family N-acetyltransferase n=1 Tax=Paenibacillus radicis (ex Xue et al. 2023) TaxID=2972489 RepID=A0ABT1YKH4_9BACL|nr:GNAT family N-acetyltransferase [Paenibacillus radicis (ex Xue et al. 2023)]MCR8633230.1 GNAT family N-acetyltransferase [Paenibacillus radicis (ex Xue et al. 2023)]
MIRKRIPKQDDKAIWNLIVLLLVPFARKTQPNLRVDMATVRARLRRCTTFIALNGGRSPSGFISLKFEKHAMFVDMLAVHPRSQGRGLGSRLLEHAERVALQAGYNEVCLWVDEANRSAQQFYSSRHYEAAHYDSTIKCYLMVKRLHQHRFQSM